METFLQCLRVSGCFLVPLDSGFKIFYLVFIIFYLWENPFICVVYTLKIFPHRYLPLYSLLLVFSLSFKWLISIDLFSSQVTLLSYSVIFIFCMLYYSLLQFSFGSLYSYYFSSHIFLCHLDHSYKICFKIVATSNIWVIVGLVSPLITFFLEYGLHFLFLFY